MVQPLTPADQAEIDGHSEQGFIELLYVKTANDVIGSALGQLEQALQVSSSILQTLTALQNEKNKLSVSNRSVGALPSSESAYIKFASAVFGSPITPVLSAGFVAASVTALAAQLAQQLAALGPIVGTSGMNNPNGLYQHIQKVLNDINKSGPSAWVLDNFDKTGNGTTSGAGDYQNDLSLAITAGQSLSSTQQEQVRNYLFIFEEYYKSAGSMLNTITSVIQMIAQNISRQ